MNIPENEIGNNHLTIDKFRDMDYLSVDKYNIPIELLMENAGLQLARLVAHLKPNKGNILIGVGTGNNGGGGLVAARRLSGWGYHVFLDVPNLNLQDLPQLQLERALNYGAVIENINGPDVFIDAYLGFSQRLPLSDAIQSAINNTNNLSCLKISLDLPTGFDRDTSNAIFKPTVILTLGAMKTELIPLLSSVEIYIADLGLPKKVYSHFGIEQANGFQEFGIVKCRPLL